MTDSFLIDAHTHAFPDEAYGRAWQQPAGHAIERTGTVQELDDCMRRGGIDRAAILLFPRSNDLADELRRKWGRDRTEEELRVEVVEDIRRLNRWGCDLAAEDERFIPFVGVNPRFMHPEEMLAEMEELASRGARGVKLILAAMQLYANDRSLFPVYEWCAQKGIPLLSQSGSGGTQPTGGADHFGRPKYFIEPLTAFPDLTLILAHMGRGYESDVSQLIRRFPRVYTDTSLRLADLGDDPDRQQEIVDLIRQMGTDRVLFGSNFPLADPADYAETITRLPFSSDEQHRLFSANFLDALGM